MSDKPEAAIEVTVDGMTFIQQQNLTFEQDMFLMTLATDAGLGPGKLKGIDLEKKAQALVVEAYRSGKMFEIVGTVLVDKAKQDETWGPEVTARNAKIFANCREKSAKDFLRQVMVGLLLGFTLGVDESLGTSPKSSDAAATSP